ncbi:VOC family protein [Gammaproteobacteria bacterium]|nr:VOC family protein [Gammaproteobacteria bacterium]
MGDPPNIAVNDLTLHHLGYASDSINAALKYWAPFLVDGQPVMEFQDSEQNVNVAFYNLTGELLIEIIEPRSNSSPIQRFIAGNNGGGLHHVAYSHASFDQALLEMRSAQFRRVTPVTRGFEGRKIAFFLPRDGKSTPLIEIISSPG